MPAAIAIPALIGAAGTVGGALINRSATNSAQKAQQQSTNQAQGIQSQVYGDTRASIAPYLSTGGAAMSSLGQMVGLPATPTPLMTNGAGTRAGSLAALAGATHSPTVTATQDLGQAVARAVPVANQSQSGYVTMRAPDGSQKAVSPDQVGHYQALGATVVQ